MKNIVNFTEPQSKRVQDFIAKGGKVKVVNREQTLKTLNKQEGGHYNARFTRQDWNGKYSASDREHKGKYKIENNLLPSLGLNNMDIDTTIDKIKEIYKK